MSENTTNEKKSIFPQQFGEKPYAVLCYDAKTGKLLGRLTPDGTATNRNIYAMMLPKKRAEEIAQEINDDGEFTAKVIKF